MSETITNSPIASLERFVAPLSKFARGGLVALLLVNLCLLVYFIAYGYQGYFNSDSAVKNLLAQEIYETGKYFPVDWNYVNADLMVVFGQLFVLPLLPFFDNGYALHAASGMISAGLILLATWLVTGVITRSLWTRLLCLTIVASGVSEVMAENLFGQVSYGNVFYMACFTVFFAWSFLNAEGRARWSWGTLVAVSSMLLFWANPQRAIASYGLPLIVATAAYTAASMVRVGTHWSPRVARAVLLLALLGLGATLGIGLHKWVLAGVSNTPGAGAARWLPFDEMTKNFVNTIHGLLSVFGGVPVASREVTTILGMYEGIRLLATCSLLVFVPIALVKAFRHASDGIRFVGVFTIVSMTLFLFLHVTTTIPDMSDPATTARYLVPPLLFALLMVVVTVFDTSSGLVYRTLGSAVLVVLATSAFSTTNPVSLGITGRAADPRQELLRLLESNGLKYGYGTYWNAGALTVLSGQQVRVRQIDLEQGMPVPKRHLSSNRWYRPDAWQGETFLLLRDSEAKSVKWDVVTAYAGKPSRTLRFGDFGVYVFPRNIAAAMPNWSDDLTHPLSVRISETSFHQIGTFQSTDGRGTLVSEPGQSGYIHFGPYLRLKLGAYRAMVDVETISSAPAKFGTVDITSSGGATVHAASPLDALGRQQVALEFKLDHVVGDLEIRVFSTGAGRMKVRGIELTPAK